jgi:hypothetical protein
MKGLIRPGLLIVVSALLLWASGMATATWNHAVNPGRLSEPHAFLDTRCSACHTPARGVEASGCIVCHANNLELLQRQPTAFHASIGSCAECHPEHMGRVRRPITMSHGALARIGRRLEAASASADESVTQREGALDCAACHSKEDPHSGQFGTTCDACHTVERWSIPAFRHPSPRSRDCAQCHPTPPCHRTTHFRDVCAQVADKPNAQVHECYSCHQSTAWNDIKGVGWYRSH